MQKYENSAFHSDTRRREKKRKGGKVKGKKYKMKKKIQG